MEDLMKKYKEKLQASSEDSEVRIWQKIETRENSSRRDSSAKEQSTPLRPFLLTLAMVLTPIVCLSIISIPLVFDGLFDRDEDVTVRREGELAYAQSCNSLSEQLKDFNSSGDGPFDMLRDSIQPDANVSLESQDGAASAPQFFTETNVQVEGIDEGDIIKTDGKILATIDSQSRQVNILRAFPTEDAEKLSEIVFETDSPAELLIYQDKLVVFTNVFNPEELPEYRTQADNNISSDVMVEERLFYGSNYTGIRVYDISNLENPSLEREIEIEGSLNTTRLKGNYVYLVTNTYAQDLDNPIPLLRDDATGDDFLPSCECDEVAILDEDYFYPNFTSILSFDITNKNDGAEVANFLGSTDTVYMSFDNIYLASNHYKFSPRPGETNDYTKLNKINYDKDDFEFVASAKFNGRLINQFALDEFAGYLRLAGTLGNSFEDTSENYLLVLDEELESVAQIRDIANGESIFSARFRGETGVIVTFKKVDPLFVFDLSDPENPVLQGELKIPGYSDYLHFIDEDTIIGLGKDTIAASEDQQSQRSLDFAWYQGIKIAIFEISDPNNPEQLSQLILGDRGSESLALRNHRAFVYDSRNDLVIIPAVITEVDRDKCTNSGFFSDPAACFGDPVSQGAQVIEVNNDKTQLRLRGEISHLGERGGNGYGFINQYSEDAVKRSLVIEDVILTVSDVKVKLNQVDNLQLIDEITLRRMPPREPIIIE
jgi:uncharacterized secreted protein with C-terminal beta-propeller domain